MAHVQDLCGNSWPSQWSPSASHFVGYHQNWETKHGSYVVWGAMDPPKSSSNLQFLWTIRYIDPTKHAQYLCGLRCSSSSPPVEIPGSASCHNTRALSTISGSTTPVFKRHLSAFVMLRTKSAIGLSTSEDPVCSCIQKMLAVFHTEHLDNNVDLHYVWFRTEIHWHGSANLSPPTQFMRGRSWL